jgi:hypothetical protein
MKEGRDEKAIEEGSQSDPSTEAHEPTPPPGNGGQGLQAA